MSRKPKQSVTVQLPSAFVDFMHNVNQRIEDGDEAATTIESDDLLQCDCGYGGLYDIDGQRYGFCYFHTVGVELELTVRDEPVGFFGACFC